MNRRKFLKGVVAVAVGAVAVPTIASTLTTQDVMDAVQVPWGDKYTWTQVQGIYFPGTRNQAPEFYLNEVTSTPKYELGSTVITSDGRHYRYMKNCNTEQLMVEVMRKC